MVTNAIIYLGFVEPIEVLKKPCQESTRFSSLFHDVIADCLENLWICEVKRHRNTLCNYAIVTKGFHIVRGVDQRHLEFPAALTDLAP